LVIYKGSLFGLNQLGWLAAFWFAATCALRLARFNIQVPDKRFFIGLPCPPAAAVVAGFVWVCADRHWSMERISILIAMCVLALGALMVSRLKYYSFKDIDFKGSVPFMMLLAVVALFGIVAWDPPLVLFSLFSLYALSGPVLWLKHKRKTIS
jgi:CDP-diacylglycerol--serine O-phosphatidyltransferase